MAEVAIPQQMFREILQLIAELRPKPPPAPTEPADSDAFKVNRQEECAQMPRKIQHFGPKKTAPGPDCRRPATNRVGPPGKPRKPLPSAPSAGFIWGIPVK